MSLNPWQDLKTMMPSMLAILQQCQQDPNPIDPNSIDVGQAIEVRDILNDLIYAVQQAQSGEPKKGGATKQGGQAKPTSSSSSDDEETQKKNQSQ